MTGVAVLVLAVLVAAGWVAIVRLRREVARLRSILMRLSLVAFTTSDTVSSLVDEWEGS